MEYVELVRPRHLFSSITIFLIGSAFYWRINGFINPLISLISFVLIYASVYIYNDINDLEFDKKHFVKWKRMRPLAKGVIKPIIAKRILLLYLISGLLVSLLVNYLFTLLILLIVLINFSYSKFQLKSNPLIGNSIIGVVQFIKLLSGWFACGLRTNFPLLFFISYSLIYCFVLSLYKHKLFSNRSALVIYAHLTGLSGLLLMMLSIIYYKLISILPVIILLFIVGSIIVKVFAKNVSNNFFTGFIVLPLFNIIIIISLLL